MPNLSFQIKIKIMFYIFLCMKIGFAQCPLLMRCKNLFEIYNFALSICTLTNLVKSSVLKWILLNFLFGSIENGENNQRIKRKINSKETSSGAMKPPCVSFSFFSFHLLVLLILSFLGFFR